MTVFAHFVLTRFNDPLKLAVSSGTADQPKAVAESRMVRWFELFERPCLASKKRQTGKAFQWHVFLYWGTHVAFKERMAALAVRKDFLRPIFGTAYLEENVIEKIRRRRTSGSTRFMTWLAPDAGIHGLSKPFWDVANSRLSSTAVSAACRSGSAPKPFAAPSTSARGAGRVG